MAAIGVAWDYSALFVACSVAEHIRAAAVTGKPKKSRWDVLHLKPCQFEPSLPPVKIARGE